MMNIYFTTRQIPALAGTNMQQRIALLRQASEKLTIPEKMLLNIAKLAVITPVFLLIAWYAEHGWIAATAIAAALPAYLLILRPMQLSLCAKYLDSING